MEGDRVEATKVATDSKNYAPFVCPSNHGLADVKLLQYPANRSVERWGNRTVLGLKVLTRWMSRKMAAIPMGSEEGGEGKGTKRKQGKEEVKRKEK